MSLPIDDSDMAPRAGVEPSHGLRDKQVSPPGDLRGIWLERPDSNRRSWSQSPESYRWTTLQELGRGRVVRDGSLRTDLSTPDDIEQRTVVGPEGFEPP